MWKYVTFYSAIKKRNKQILEIYSAWFIHNDVGAFDWESGNNYYINQKW